MSRPCPAGISRALRRAYSHMTRNILPSPVPLTPLPIPTVVSSLPYPPLSLYSASPLSLLQVSPAPPPALTSPLLSSLLNMDNILPALPPTLILRAQPTFVDRPYATWPEECVAADLTLIDPLGKLVKPTTVVVKEEVRVEVEMDTWWI
jgi:hypothetical protein